MSDLNNIINQILCDIKTLKETTVKKISVKEDNVLKTDDVTVLNFTGDVDVTALNGVAEINITGGGADCDECLEFDGDRVITRDVLGLLGENLGTQGVIETLEELLYPYLPPSITLSVTQTVREKDDIDYSVTATIVTTKGSANITVVTLDRDNIEIYNESSVNPNGQTINVTENILGTDNTDLTPYLVPYRASVGDGISNVLSPIRNVTFVYPFYQGIGVAALDENGIKLLGKAVTTKGNKAYTYSPSNQKIYIAYPASYGNLVLISDGALNLNGAFTLRTDTFTMLDGQSVLYNIYESNNLLTTVSYTVYYNFS